MDHPEQDELPHRPELSKVDFKSLYREGPNLALILGWIFSILGLIPCALLLLFAGMSVSHLGLGIYVFVFAIPSLFAGVCLLYDFNRKTPLKMSMKWKIPAILTGLELLFIFVL